LEPWRLRFGVSRTTVPVQVPEPASLALLVVAMSLVCRKGTRRQNRKGEARVEACAGSKRLGGSLALPGAFIVMFVSVSLPTDLRGAEAGPQAESWPEADALFHRDADWLGGDGASSVNLGDGRILWLFADSFVANEPGATRLNSTMVHNTVGIQSKRNPIRAEFKTFWDAGGERPASFFLDEGEHWFWPGDGELIDGKLIVFLIRVERTDKGLGFRTLDWRVVLIDNPLEPPVKWSPRRLKVPANSFDVRIGFGTVRREGDYLYAFGPRTGTFNHPLYLVRWPVANLLAGDLSAPEWWSAREQAWLVHETLTAPPEPVITNGQAEFTVDKIEPTGRYVQVQTSFFPFGPLVMRTAPALVGPWSEARAFYRPPEIEAPRDGFYMYSGKAHPEQDAGGQLAVTYCTNLRSIHDLVRDSTIYYPRFARVPIERDGR
jgi:hypothetical protein